MIIIGIVIGLLFLNKILELLRYDDIIKEEINKELIIVR